MNYSPVPEHLKKTRLLLVLQYDNGEPYYVLGKPITLESLSSTELLAWQELEPIKQKFYCVEGLNFKIHTYEVSYPLHVYKLHEVFFTLREAEDYLKKLTDARLNSYKD
jgi:hypothetical protein